MDIESLLDPIFSMGTKWEHQTRKIVANAIEAHDAMDKNGRFNVVIKLVTTQRELIKAVLMIRKHINGSNNSLTQKIDAILGSFTQQLCFEKLREWKIVQSLTFLRVNRLSALFNNSTIFSLIFAVFAIL